MKNYDCIVIGSGAGAMISDEGVGHGLKVAMVDRGPLGGTCLNVGCIPSKMLIYPADRIVEIEEGKKLGVKAETKGIDFAGILDRMRKSVKESRDYIRKGMEAISEYLDLYEAEARFVGEYTLEVEGERIRGDKVFIAAGSRPFAPPIKGIDSVDYWTNETVLQQTERPESLIIIGGGYIAVEYGHFFAAMGTKVTILEMADRLVLAEEPEISELLKKALNRRMEVHTSAMAEEIKGDGKGGVVVVAKTDGGNREYTAQKLLMAVGRKANADLLKLEKSGVKVDQKGFVKVNEHMQTTKKNIFAVGDVNGLQMFTHAANRQAAIVADNVLHGSKTKVDLSATPHAVYSHPQIASVGLTEEKAKREREVLVGRAKYASVAKGEAMMEEDGFAKAVLDKKNSKILGFHIIGPMAPELIQEVTNALATGGSLDPIIAGMHIHPATNELIQAALSNLEEA